MSSRVLLTSYSPVSIVETQSARQLGLLSSIIIETAPPAAGTGNADGVASVSGVPAISSVGNADGVASVDGVPVSSHGAGNADGIATANAVSISSRGVGLADGIASAAGIAVTGVASSGGAAMMTA